MTPEEKANEDLAATRQATPPFRPSVILRDLYGVKTARGNVRGGTTQAVLIPGREPRCVVSSIIGTAQARIKVGHEAGHAAMGHVRPSTFFDTPAFSSGLTFPKDKESEAQRYGVAVTMPKFALTEALADGPRSLPDLAKEFDVPESDLRRQLHTVELWRLVYDDRKPEAYRASGWWKLTRQPRYLASLAERQGRPKPLCEAAGCHRLATVVHHHHYESPGCEEDDDLEGLCSQCHYEQHVSGRAVATWPTRARS